MKLLTLEEWANLRFGKPPCMATLRRWARNGMIHPPPTKATKAYLVRDDAELVGSNPLPNGRLVERI